MERFLTSDRLISYHRNKLDVTPFPGDKLNIAFLNRKFDQYEFHLTKSPDDLVLTTIKEIYQELQDGCEVYAYGILNTKILVILFNHLKTNKNPHIRINSALCFKQFCRINTSKQLLDEIKILTQLDSILDDNEPELRLYTTEGLIYYAAYREGQECLIKNKVLELVIQKISKEESELVLFKLLELSYELLKADNATNIALSNNFIHILKNYVTHVKIKIRINTFKNYSSLSMSEYGKQQCTNEGELIRICLEQVFEQLNLNQENLDDNKRKYTKRDSMDLMVQMTRFLNSVSILKQAKEEIFKYKGLEQGLLLLNYVVNGTDLSYSKEDKEQLIINTLQYIGNTSEDPSSRKYMIDHLSELNIFLKSDNSFIKEQAEITIKIIKWKP